MNRAARRKQAKGGAELGKLLQQGMALHQQGRVAEAEQCYGAVLKADSKQPDALQLQALIDHQAGRLDLAQKRMQQSLARKAEQPHVWYNLAKVLHENGDMAGAIDANSRAIVLQENHIDAYMNRANIYTQLGEYEKAVADFELVMELQPDHPHVWEPLVLSLKEVGRQEDAIALLHKLLNDNTNQANIWCSLAKALRDQGDKAGAIEGFEKAIKLAPNYAEAHYNLSLIVKYSAETLYNKEKLESIVDDKASMDDAIYLHFALAKAYDDLDEMKNAFTHYNKANALKRGETDYDTKRVADYFARIEATFSKKFIDKKVDVASDVTPIFILGMPRSGTSLVEQILASHSAVTGAGELNDLHQAIGEDYIEKVEHLSDNQLKRMAKNYLEKLSAHGDTTYICDKMPMNFHYIGMIRKILPQAKIVHVMRDPVNTCLSIYTRLFFGNQPFAYDQTELGEHYQLYSQLMEYWREVVGDAMLDVSYEKMVDDTQSQVQRLLEFCGLDWEDNCLDFHNTKRMVDTASAMQVRQPIYRTSLDRAQTYTPYIQPLINALKE